ncbi:MAG TPA: LacI family DNA-binding transcriptional regulator [Chloroflexia bacterium]|nr:LacI family DNA-binding transcriptional regulator [Chloroflexia bacterium]
MNPKGSKRLPTMSDVARLAGVSRTTVSFVLNNNDISASIPEETKERIQEAAKKLSYRPNLAAKTLRTSQTHTIGFITDEIATTPHAVNIIKGAQNRAWSDGKLLLIVNCGSNLAIKEAAIEMMLERQVEGLIYAAMYHQAVELPANIYEAPAVLLDCFSTNRSLPSVVPDEVQGGRTATEVLLAKGHRRIGFINNLDQIPASAGRLEGYKQALISNGINFDERLVSYQKSSSAGGYQGTMELMQLSEPPSAIFCFSDFMAMGTYDALRKLGLSIPEDVAVMGFDNHELIASQLYPPLSTMELPHAQMGEWAVQFLLEHAGEKLPLVQQTLECPYIERASI